MRQRSVFFYSCYSCVEAEEDGFDGGVVNQLVSFLAEGLCVFDAGDSVTANIINAARQ